MKEKLKKTDTGKKPIVTNMKTICDKCNKEFKTKPSKVKTKFITDDIEKMSFKCPHCKTEYIIGYRNSEVRENIARILEIVEIVNKGQGKLQEKQFENLYQEYKELKDRNMELSNRCKSIFK